MGQLEAHNKLKAVLSCVRGYCQCPYVQPTCVRTGYVDATTYVLQATLNFCNWQMECHVLYIDGTSLLNCNRSIC
jgi:hypothetical protein